MRAFDLVGLGTEGISLVVPSFQLLFNDTGSGAVSLSAIAGGVSGTFTRATTATTVLPSGLIGSVASGVLRSYYDPTSLAYLGALFERQRTNLLLRSEEFNDATWAKTDTTITANDTTAPDGAATADLCTEGVAGTAIITQAVTATANGNYAVSFFVRRGNHDWLRVVFANGGNAAQFWFNLGTGAVGSTAVAGTATIVSRRIVAYTNSWYRIECVGTVGSGATAITVAINSASGDLSVVRVANGTRHQWGAQFEDNSLNCSSYIPTAGATATRNADVLTYPLTGWFNATVGTFVITGMTPCTAASSQVLMAVSDGTGNEVISMFTSVADPVFVVTDGGVSVGIGDAGTATAFVQFKMAGAYAADDLAVSINGGAVVTDSTVTLPTVNILNVGSYATGVNQPTGTVRALDYYGGRRSNAVLQQLSVL